MSTQITCTSKIVFYPKSSKKFTTLTQVKNAPLRKVYSSSIMMRKRRFKRRCDWK